MNYSEPWLLENISNLLRVDNIVSKVPVQADPVRSSINKDSSRQRSLPQPPHTRLTLVECLVQALLLDELGVISPVTLEYY